MTKLSPRLEGLRDYNTNISLPAARFSLLSKSLYLIVSWNRIREDQKFVTKNPDIDLCSFLYTIIIYLFLIIPSPNFLL